MQGKKLIFIVAAILAGCSPARRANIGIPFEKADSYIELSDKILSRNMTTGNFNIVKAEVEIINNGDSQKLIASCKYRTPENYLLSIRNRTGIEAARIYITKDTILINDRIYRKLYCGSNEYLMDKYGLATNALPLIFGDYIDQITEIEQLKDCKNGTAEIQGYLDRKEIWYYLDCGRAKVSAISLCDKAGTAGINFRYSNFKSVGKFIYPGQINIEDIKGRTKIGIKILSVEYQNIEQIGFIPGRNYEKIILK